MILLDTAKMTMTLSGVPNPVPVTDDNSSIQYRQTGNDADVVETKLTIKGEGEIIWPNREGERFSLAAAHEKLKRLDRQNSGISLCWPATASVQAVGIIDGGTLYTFYADPDSPGRARFLELKSEEPGHVSFNFKGSSVSWTLLSIQQTDSEQTRDPGESEASLYQIGLIGPEGECEVPIDRGFAILGDAARTLIDKCGAPVPGDIIHIFGYAAGHDRGYPDYSPSAELGGAPALKSALGELRALGFELSFYLNARLAELSILPAY
ncbi:MAG: hypothetical protein KAH21_07250, partial [Spirochaetaceae bacterium]|nr:hypothetical protein [Spirochaetaceae bacterium]